MTRATKSKVKGGRATRRRHTEEFKREALGLAEKIGLFLALTGSFGSQAFDVLVSRQRTNRWNWFGALLRLVLRSAGWNSRLIGFRIGRRYSVSVTLFR